MDKKTLNDLDILLSYHVKHKKFSFEEVINEHRWSIEYFGALIHQLEEDGFIKTSIIESSVKTVTIKGLIFEGYVNNSKSESMRFLLLQVSTWMTAVGTGLAGVYGLFEMVKWAYHHFCGC